MIKQTILWADDDLDDLQLMRDILDKNGLKVQITEVYNGREALDYLEQAALEKNLPCLIILDINMPVLDGKQTLSQIKSNEDLAHVPVVVFTTSHSEMDKSFCKKFDTEMITKPPNFGSLENVVLRMLRICDPSGN
jgi:CheY-like chemotaxis protein